MGIPFVPAIAVVGLLQMCVMVATVLSVATMVHVSGYPDYFPLEAYRDDTVFIRRWGLILLLIPVAWSAFASWDLEKNPEPMTGLRGHLIVGVVVLIIMSYFAMSFTARAISPKGGSILIEAPDAN